MARAAQQLIGWWRVRSTWVRVVLVLFLLPLVPAVLIAARFGNSGGGKAAAATAAIVGFVVYAAAASEPTPAPSREDGSVTATAEPAAAPSPTSAPTSTTHTESPAEQLQHAVLQALGVMRSDVVAVDAQAEASEVIVETRLPWSRDTDVDLAVRMCEAVLGEVDHRVTVTSSTGETLASGDASSCQGPDRLPLGDLELAAGALQETHEQVTAVEATTSRVVVMTAWTLAWDTPLDLAREVCEEALAYAGEGWDVTVRDADGRSLASGGVTCDARASLPSPTPPPEPEIAAPAPPEPEPEPEVAAPAPPEPEPEPANDCHPSYTGACVPAGVSDVDCAGGSGNGPAYTGRVNVVGPDVFDLDRDGDGVACE